ncbi:MAG: hypothetical protein U9N14_01760, partial [Pseudomonadota bacterium]|nr:hypothetical protein [Pseudomonadota bacterium]
GIAGNEVIFLTQPIRGMVDKQLIICMLLLIAGLNVAAFWPAMRPLYKHLPDMAVTGLLFVLMLAIAIKPAHMSQSITAFAANIFGMGRWGSLGMALLVLYTAIWLSGPSRDFYSRMIPRFIAAYILALLFLSFFRIPYRVNWGDSANRMMVHIVPLLLTYAGLWLAGSYSSLNMSRGQKYCARMD